MQQYKDGDIADGPNGPLVYSGGKWRPAPANGGAVFIPKPNDPTAPYEGPRAAADTQRAQAQAQAAAAEAPYAPAIAAATARKTGAEATAAEVATNETVREARLWEDAQERKAMNQAFQTDNILGAIRNARKIAQEEGGTGWESLLSGLPAGVAMRLQSELSPIMGTLAFDKLQQIRDESKTGGGVGSVSDTEMKLLASTVADLNPKLDLPTFLERLDTIERHFIGMQLNALGLDPKSEEGRSAFKDEYGYTGVFDGEAGGDNPGIGAADASQTSVPIPPEYQEAHLRYLRDNWGNIDPQAYVRFRTALDEQFELTPDLSAYAAAVPKMNELAAQGAPPEGAGSVPSPVRDMGAIEQGLNKAVQSAPGAAFANATNAFAMGLPGRLGGAQDQLDLVREARPYSSAFGELVGGATGALATGMGAGAIGGRAASMLGNPFASEALHSTVYGATQDDNTLRGAGYGLGGALAGSAIGRQIGKAFPETFAPNATRQADESVPTVDELKQLADQQYLDVQNAGVVASPQDTQDMLARAQRILRDESKITPKGRLTQLDGKTSEAMRLLEDYAGNPMRPVDAKSVRTALAEGRGSLDKSEARIAGLLTKDFDDWADPVLPGIDAPRATAQRYIQGQQLQERGGIADIRGQRMKGNDVGDSYRTQFGQVDEAVMKGNAHFDEATTEAIAKAARGDKLTNALRALGKYGLGNPLTAGGIGAGGMGAALNLVDPIYTAAAVTGGLFGSGARKAASNRTTRAAQEAELIALGGDEYRELLKKAADYAAANSGRIFGGAGGATASMSTR